MMQYATLLNKMGPCFGVLFLGRSSKPFRAPGRIASGVFYLEVSLALVGVASPAYSNNNRFHFWKQHFFIFIFKKPLPRQVRVSKTLIAQRISLPPWPAARAVWESRRVRPVKSRGTRSSSPLLPYQADVLKHPFDTKVGGKVPFQDERQRRFADLTAAGRVRRAPGTAPQARNARHVVITRVWVTMAARMLPA